MRLPADAALIVIYAQRALDDPASGPRNNPLAEGAIALLLKAWRAEALPILHVRPDAPSHAFNPEAAPAAGETIVASTTPDAFAGTKLQARLDAFAATTLVICGALTHNAVETSVRAAASRGYRVFVVADACWTVDVVDLLGRNWPAEAVHWLSLSHMHREFGRVVGLQTVLEAAAMAKRRQRWKAERDAAST